MKEDAKGCAFVAHFRIRTVSLDTTNNGEEGRITLKLILDTDLEAGN